MKKLISILLVLCMTLCLTSTAFAASLTPKASEDVVKPGDTVVISTMLDENIECATFAYRLYYDSDKFEFSAMRTGMWIEGLVAPQVDSEGRSYITICYSSVWGDNETVKSGGNSGISNPEFIAKETVTEMVDSYFELEFYNCYDENLNPIQMTGGKIAVTIDPPIEGYYVEAGKDAETNVGETVKEYIVVNNDDETYYNAYHLVVNYDADKLIYKGINTDATVKDENGTLTITGYGADLKTFWNDIILTFEAKAPGEADITIVSANIDKAANANTQDTPAATIKKASKTFTIGGYEVDLSDDFTGEGTVAPGADYTFTAKDKHYDYNISATMGGEATEVTDNGDGTFTIKNVTGNLVIKDTKSPKKYTVTVDGSAKADVTAADKAAYLTDYTFTVAQNGYFNYEVSATVGGQAYSLTQGENGSYTIAGADVTGDIAITVNKTRKPDAYTTVNFTGTGSADVVGGTTQSAPNGEDFTFEITEVEGYDYTVMLDNDALTADEDGKYTIAGSKLTGTALTVTVEKVGHIDIDASAYLELNGKTMWLVTAGGTVSDGKILAYDGNAMFWSAKYNAYCYLVISEKSLDEVKADAVTKIAEAAAEKVSVAYDYDVNKTSLVDVNDAQLTYDMYNAKYDGFDVVSMNKFLEADVNGDKLVNVTDAAAIVSHILAI